MKNYKKDPTMLPQESSGSALGSHWDMLEKVRLRGVSIMYNLIHLRLLLHPVII